MPFNNVPPIHVYTRAQAIADGVLVDLSATSEAKEAGFKYPVACTHAVWEKFVTWSDEDTQRQTFQDVPGRLWDMLYMLGVAIRCNRTDPTRLLFEFYCVPRGGKGRSPHRTVLKAICGPGDNAEPVITIMLPTED